MNGVAARGQMGVVVVNFGSHRLLERNLSDLPIGPLFTVIIVDNHSTQQEAAQVQRLAERSGWHAVLLPDNRGFAAGVNAGVRHARSLGCESVLLLNPDVTFSLETLVALRNQAAATPDAMVSPVVRTPSWTPRGYPVLDLRSGVVRVADRRPEPGRVMRWLPATCLAIHGNLLARLGDLDEGYFMYWEDIELSAHCLHAGGSVLLRDDLEVCHDAMGTQPRGVAPKSLLYYRYNCRNRLLFAARNLPSRDVVRWIVLTPSASWQILMQGGRRQLLRSLGPLWAAVRGSVEGIALAAAALVRPRSRPAPRACVWSAT